jgi:plasmid stability protein
MAAITIRNLSDPVHEWLKDRARARTISVEALCRTLLAEARVLDGQPGSGPKASGMADAQAGNSVPPKAGPAHKMQDLWGALKGSVHIPTDADLTALLLEAWQVEG